MKIRALKIQIKFSTHFLYHSSDAAWDGTIY